MPDEVPPNPPAPGEYSVRPMSDFKQQRALLKTRIRRRGIYLLPNLFTLAALFAGFYGIVQAMGERFDNSAAAIFVAMVLDGLDGRVGFDLAHLLVGGARLVGRRNGVLADQGALVLGIVLQGEAAIFVGIAPAGSAIVRLEGNAQAGDGLAVVCRHAGDLDNLRAAGAAECREQTAKQSERDHSDAHGERSVG